MRKKKQPNRAVIEVPATTANLGTGFDALGIALRLANRCAVARLDGRDWKWDGAPAQAARMMREAAAAFFKRARRPRFGFSVKISGPVPPARGLGSSVIVRLGVIAGLNVLAGSPLEREDLLELVAELEGHPDNAAPAVLGGFVVSALGEDGRSVHRVRGLPDRRLKFILLIPDRELSTRKARRVLPASYSRADAVHNLSRACLLAASLLQREKGPLWHAVDDRLHQPYRARLFRPLYPVLKAAQKAGAVAGWLSGSGSAVCLLARGGQAARIIKAIRRKVPASRNWKVRVVDADKRGYRVL
jgi:homoserine kinase